MLGNTFSSILSFSSRFRNKGRIPSWNQIKANLITPFAIYIIWKAIFWKWIFKNDERRQLNCHYSRFFKTFYNVTTYQEVTCFPISAHRRVLIIKLGVVFGCLHCVLSKKPLMFLLFWFSLGDGHIGVSLLHACCILSDQFLQWGFPWTPCSLANAFIK